MNTPCTKIQEQLVDLLLDNLDLEQTEIVQKHLNSCSVCQSYFEQHQNQEKELEHMGTRITNKLQEQQENVIQALNTLPTHPAQPDKSAWSTILHSRITKPLAAAIIIIAALTGIYQLTGSIDGASVAWADVVEQFHSVKYFSAVFYHKPDGQSEPEQIELWVGRGGKARIHIDGQIVFCSDSRIVQAFDMKTGKAVEPSQMAKGLYDTLLRNLTEFSLNIFLELADGVKLVDVTAVMNEDSLISNELVMFDVKHQESPQWFRIWALRKSKLPLHIRMLDPRDGACDDVVFDYSKELKESFFDPEAFLTEVKTVNNKNLIPYLLWEDPTGKTLTPKEPDQDAVFDFHAQTISGKPWNYAEHQGKVILIQFWFGSDSLFRSFTRSVEDRFGQRDDFLKTVILLRNTEKASSYFNDKPDWILLQDSYENIQKVFGSISEQSVFIVDKYGHLQKLSNVDTRFGVAAVDEALNGLVYDSYWMGLIKPELHGAPEEAVIKQYGNPDSIEIKDEKTEWYYRRYNDDKTEYISVTVRFNQNKRVAGISSGHRIVDPATIKFSISDTWWNDEILEKIDPALLSNPNAVFTVSLSKDPYSYLLGGDAYGQKPETIQTNKTYSRKIVPGTYILEIELRETRSPYKQLWNRLIIENLELSGNQEKIIEL